MSDSVYGDSSTLVREEASHERLASPVTRLRRPGRTPGLWPLVRETHLDIGDLILPLIVTDGEDVSKEIESMLPPRRRTGLTSARRFSGPLRR